MDYKRVGDQTEREVEARKTAQQVLRVLNDYGHDEIIAAFSDEVRRGHCTLQQTLFKALVALINDWATDYEKQRFDGRNEFTCKCSVALREKLKELGAIYECSDGRRVTVPFI
ncbi:MAG: hypothetical protein ABFE07_28970 [Armatimonadia bacterium]